MTRFKTVYGFEVMKELARGTRVYVISRNEAEIKVCGSIDGAELARYIELSELPTSEGGIEFYKEVQEV